MMKTSMVGLMAGAWLALSVLEAGAVSVQVTSPRIGLTFADDEPVEVGVRVTGQGEIAKVAFRLEETEGDWHQSGEVVARLDADGEDVAKLPLAPPGRGLYRLRLEANDGHDTATCETSLGVVFRPLPVSEASPWGIFYIPFTFQGRTSDESMVDIARNIRLLGASWVRFNFWSHIYGKVTAEPGDPPRARGDWSEARKMVRALRAEGLHVMGELAQCPRELSSQPDAMGTAGDAGPVHNRVKPADYRVWDAFIEDLARDFAGDIDVWEIWNEANIPNAYWTGTVEDFAELVRHSSRALKAGNPRARVAAAGFVGGHEFADRLFELGMGKDIDILSVHYTDINPGWLPAWKALLEKHGLNLPIWNSEELSEVPTRNIAADIEHSFKFCHIYIGYDAFRLMVNQDLTPRRSAIEFSVGANRIGNARWVAHDSAPGCELDLFRRGDELVAVVGQRAQSAKLFEQCRSVTLRAEPVTPGQPLEATDALGRTKTLELVNGEATLPLAGLDVASGTRWFINGASSLQVVSADLGSWSDIAVFEAEEGRWSGGWGPGTHDGFSGGRTVDIWSDAEPGPEGHWAEVDVTAPRAGRYELLWAGNGLQRLTEPASISPFVWTLDGGAEHNAAEARPFGQGVSGAPEGVSVLGTFDLTEGKHTFRLRLTGRRAQYDTHYALWIDALALRPVTGAH